MEILFSRKRLLIDKYHIWIQGKLQCILLLQKKIHSIFRLSNCDASAPTDVTVGIADEFWYPREWRSLVTVLKLTFTVPCERTLVTVNRSFLVLKLCKLVPISCATGPRSHLLCPLLELVPWGPHILDDVLLTMQSFSEEAK